MSIVEEPTIVDKEFADALRKYAQYIARAALFRGGGISISNDVKVRKTDLTFFYFILFLSIRNKLLEST